MNYLDRNRKIEVTTRLAHTLRSLWKKIVNALFEQWCIVLIISGVLTNTAHAQVNFDWAKLTQVPGGVVSSNNKADFSYTTADALGNVYTAGMFDGSIDFNPCDAQSAMNSNGSSDIYIVKHDTNGEMLWSISFGSISNDYVYGIEVDGSGNVITSGTFFNTADFDPGAGNFSITPQNIGDTNNPSTFILKLDSNGIFNWAKSFSGASECANRALAIDDNGNIYTTGVFYNTVDFDPNAGVSNLTSNFSIYASSMYISKLNSNGDFVWAKAYNSTQFGNYVIPNSIAIDGNGNVYTTGYSNNQIDFDPGVGVNALSGIAFISKLDAVGNFSWAKAFNSFSMIGLACTTDNSNNLIAAGIFSGTVDFDTGPAVTNLTVTGNNQSSAYLCKYSAAGNLIWAEVLSSTNLIQPKDVITDDSDNIYINGVTSNTDDFVTSTSANLILNGNVHSFIAKLNPNGTNNFVKFCSQQGIPYVLQSTTIALDASNNVYNGLTVGLNTVDFDPGAGQYNIVSTGLNDLVVLKLGQGTCLTPNSPQNTTPVANLDACIYTSTQLSVCGQWKISWYDAPTGGNYLGGGSNFNTPTLFGTTTFYAQDSSCTSSLARTAITVNIVPCPTFWYQDNDGDGFGNPLVSQLSESQPFGFVSDDTDCDDTPGSGFGINPLATEITNNAIDEDCDGIAQVEYCNPTVANPCTFGWIESTFIYTGVGTTNNSFNGCSPTGYGDYSTTFFATSWAGGQVDIQLYVNVDQNAYIYLDYGQDGVFDSGDLLTELPVTSGFGGFYSFVLPSNLSFGEYRLRIVTEEEGILTATACNSTNGEVEDYTITIGQAIVCTPVDFGTPCSEIWLNNVTIGSISNNTSCDGFGDFSSTNQINLRPGDAFQITVTCGFGQGFTGVYIDYNGDGDFDDADENFGLLGEMYSGTSFTWNAAVPLNTTVGLHKIRIVSSSLNGFYGSCLLLNGEVEDYGLLVQTPYCTPNITDPCGAYYIDGVNMFTNSSGNVTTPGYVINTFGDLTYCGNDGYTVFSVINLANSATLTATPGQAVGGYIKTTGDVSQQQASLFIDYNKDGDFDESDEMPIPFITIQASFYNVGYFNFVIPDYVNLGDYRMRMTLHPLSWTPSSPCDFEAGEAEDFTLHLIPCQNEASPPTFSSYYGTTICEGGYTNIEPVDDEWNGTDYYAFHTGSCNGPIAFTSFGVNAAPQVSPAVTTTYYVRGEGACVTPGACSEITITVTSPTNWYLDADIDGYYTGNPTSSCSSPGAGYTQTVTGGGDCADDNPSRYPGAPEICGNGIDENCDGIADNGCAAPPPANDSWASAITIPISGNAYPACNLLNGNCATATNSPESNDDSVVTGEDVWYKFYSGTSAVRIKLVNTAFNGVLELYNSSGVRLDSENLMSSTQDEYLNYTGLDGTQWYYIAVRNYNSASGSGVFSLCLQRLNRSYCANPGLQELCSNFKPAWTGANQYVTSFTSISNSTTVQAASSGQFPFSNPNLDLRFDESYVTYVNAIYNLVDGNGGLETIEVPGTLSKTVTIAPQPLISVKLSQVCPAILLKSVTILQYKPYICVAQDFKIKFTRVDLNNTPIELPFIITRGAALTTIPLSAITQLVSGSRYLVEVKPVFSWGEGVFGPATCVEIIGQQQFESQQLDNSYNTFKNEVEGYANFTISPNPNNGQLVNLNVIHSDQVNIRIMDAIGNVVYNKKIVIEDSLKTIIDFPQPLSSGLYLVEFTSGSEVSTEKMLVQR